MKVLKKIVLLIIAAILTGVIIFSLAFIAGINQATRSYEQKNFVEMYEQKRSEAQIRERKQLLDTFVKTGKCVACDLNARRNDAENKEINGDLYQIIQSLRAKSLPIDLSQAELFSADLSGIDLSGANLTKANLTNAKLEKANLSGANLSQADLSFTNLKGANLRGANLTEATLDKTQLEEADLTGAILHKSVLEATNLHKANLTKVDLTGAWIISTHSSEAKFVEANLLGAKILGKFAQNADFTNAKFDGFIIRSMHSFSMWVMVLWGELKSKGYYWKLHKDNKR